MEEACMFRGERFDGKGTPKGLSLLMWSRGGGTAQRGGGLKIEPPSSVSSLERTGARGLEELTTTQEGF